MSFVPALTGCGKDKKIPDVSFVDGSFSLHRFEQDLWGLDSTATDAQLAQIATDYQALWPLYFTHILPLEYTRDANPDSMQQIRTLLGDQRLRYIADTVEQEYGDLSTITAELQRAFQFYGYYFPEILPPHIYTLISDFGYFPFIFQDAYGADAIGISLELFLGADFPYASVAGNHAMFSDYLIRTYNRDHLVKKSLDVIVDDLVGPPQGDRLLDLMINNGKKLYILQHLIPESPDSVIFEFTPGQLQWCQENERRIWAHLLTNDLLYSNNYNEIKKLVTYSPNVPGMPAEAPGRVANWTACQIIHAAKARNTYLQLTDLLMMQDPQELLEMARYKP